jgi:hypothetical protein
LPWSAILPLLAIAVAAVLAVFRGCSATTLF